MAALDGMRILDLTQYEAGPSGTQALAWLGAEVVKVERPNGGEPGRYVGNGKDLSPYFWNWNSNKRSVAIDLQSEAGRRLFLELVPHYDAVVENYGPGVPEKLDIGADTVCAVNPALIYASLKGFGIKGPKARFKCFDPVAQAAAGAFSITGEADGPPMRVGPTIGDSGTGVQLALAILAAYIQRLRTGRGQRIEISMQEATTYFMRTMIAVGMGFGKEAAPRTGTGSGADIQMYRCAPGGHNDYVYITVANNRMFHALCRTIAHPDLIDDERFRSRASRLTYSKELRPLIEAWTEARNKEEAMQLLAEAGVPCGAVADTSDLFRDPHLRARGFIESVDHPLEGKVELLGWPARLSESRVPIRSAPELGEATEEILGRDLGLDRSALQRLADAGVIALKE